MDLSCRTYRHVQASSQGLLEVARKISSKFRHAIYEAAYGNVLNRDCVTLRSISWLLGGCYPNQFTAFIVCNQGENRNV